MLDNIFVTLIVVLGFFIFIRVNFKKNLKLYQSQEVKKHFEVVFIENLITSKKKQNFILFMVIISLCLLGFHYSSAISSADKALYEITLGAIILTGLHAVINLFSQRHLYTKTIPNKEIEGKVIYSLKYSYNTTSNSYFLMFIFWLVLYLLTTRVFFLGGVIMSLIMVFTCLNKSRQLDKQKRTA